MTLYYFLTMERKRTETLEVYVFFFGYFLLNQSKNNVVLEPRTGTFLGLVGFEAKAKDLKTCLQGQRSR